MALEQEVACNARCAGCKRLALFAGIHTIHTVAAFSIRPIWTPLITPSLIRKVPLSANLTLVGTQAVITLIRTLDTIAIVFIKSFGTLSPASFIVQHQAVDAL